MNKKAPLRALFLGAHGDRFRLERLRLPSGRSPKFAAVFAQIDPPARLARLRPSLRPNQCPYKPPGHCAAGRPCGLSRAAAVNILEAGAQHRIHMVELNGRLGHEIFLHAQARQGLRLVMVGIQAKLHQLGLGGMAYFHLLERPLHPRQRRDAFISGNCRVARPEHRGTNGHNQHKGCGQHQRQHVMVVAPADQVSHGINFDCGISPQALRPRAPAANQTMRDW